MSALPLHELYGTTSSAQSDPEVSWSRHSENKHQNTHKHLIPHLNWSGKMNNHSYVHLFLIYTDNTASDGVLVPSTAAINTQNFEIFVQCFLCRQQNLRRKQAGRSDSQEICSRGSLHSLGWTSGASRLSPDCPFSAGTQTSPASPAHTNSTGVIQTQLTALTGFN